MRVAAVDCGTNSVRLLVSERGPDGAALGDVVRRLEIVRLGQDVDRTGVLQPEAIERTREALVSYAEDVARTGAERLRFVATSATRDARNRDDFVAMVRDVMGVDPEVATGEEEARLTFRGALDAVEPDAPEPILVFDVGGGSTELVLGDRSGPTAMHSMDVGSVRLTERHLRRDPPTEDEVAAAARDVQAAIADAAGKVPFARAATVVGVAGTVTTVAAAVLDLDRYDPARIHGAHLTAERVAAACADLLAMSRADRTRLPYMHPGRADVIGGGALIVREVLTAAQVQSMVVSEHDILDGIAASIGGSGGNSLDP